MYCNCLSIFLALFCLTASINIKEDTCRFARQFSTQELLENPEVVDDFLRRFVRWQSNFVTEVGVDKVTGLTFDGIRVDVQSGQPLLETLHRFTASSKESIHLAIMAKSIEQSQFSEEIYYATQVFQILDKKVKALQQFYKNYPGFAGYLPWVQFVDGTIVPAHDFKSRVPALDNGEMFWAALGLSRVWEKRFPNVLPGLRQRFDQVYWKGMIRNVRKVFFNETTGKIRAVADIEDVSMTVGQNNYTNSDNYYLDDPYEGELFIWMITLLAKDQFSVEEIDFIWADKRNKLQAVDYTVKSKSGLKITVEKGWWFSAHQQWKLLFLPYFLSPTFKRIQINNERARTWHSSDNSLPGLYACQAGPAQNNTEDTGYYCSGISQIAFQKVQFDKLVTPYGAFPVLLADKRLGAVWLHNTIYSPGGQTRLGSLEGTGLNGTLVSPVLTWDTKITAALAVMNGTWAISMSFLQEKKLLEEFVIRLENEYALAFQSIKGEQVPIAVPSKQVSSGRADFTSCR